MVETILTRAPTMQSADVKVPKDKFPEKRKVVQRVKQLFEDRASWEDRWLEIRDYQLPFVGSFERSSDTSNPGRRKDLKIAQGLSLIHISEPTRPY